MDLVFYLYWTENLLPASSIYFHKMCPVFFFRPLFDFFKISLHEKRLNFTPYNPYESWNLLKNYIYGRMKPTMLYFLFFFFFHFPLFSQFFFVSLKRALWLSLLHFFLFLPCWPDFSTISSGVSNVNICTRLPNEFANVFEKFSVQFFPLCSLTEIIFTLTRCRINQITVLYTSPLQNFQLSPYRTFSSAGL